MPSELTSARTGPMVEASPRNAPTVRGSDPRASPETETSSPIKVLYLIGKGRAGGTLLNNLLGQLEGFTAPGELPRLWTWGLTEGWRCGCGEPIADCPYWSKVISIIGAPPTAVPSITRWQNEVMSWRSVPRMIKQRPGHIAWEPLRNYVEVQAKVYHAISHVSGADVIVESTRFPTAPVALDLVPGVETYLLHLVRDPRAVIYSWRRRKLLSDRPGSPEMERFGALYTMASWWSRTLLTEIVMRRSQRSRTMTVRYEDLIDDPAEYVSRIAAWVTGRSPDTTFIEDERAYIDRTHTVGGNPDRLRSGVIRLEPDDAWKQDQPLWDRLAGTLLAIPLLKRYGYPLRPRDQEQIRRTQRIDRR